MPKFEGYTPEQEAEMNTSRAKTVEELQEGGAKAKGTEQGGFVLSPTDKQLDAAYNEMHQELRQPDKFISRMGEAIKDLAEKQETTVAALKDQMTAFSAKLEENATPAEKLRLIAEFARRFERTAMDAQFEASKSEFEHGQVLEVNGYFFSIKRNEGPTHTGGGWEIRSSTFASMGPRNGVYDSILAFAPYSYYGGDKVDPRKNDAFAEEVVKFIVDTAKNFDAGPGTKRDGSTGNERELGLAIRDFIDHRTEEIHAELKKERETPLG